MKYIAFLRGINIGGHHKIDMKELVLLYESLGMYNVRTYINSGNVIFESDLTKNKLEKLLSTQTEVRFGFSVPTLIRNSTEISALIQDISLRKLQVQFAQTHIIFLPRDRDIEKNISNIDINIQVDTVSHTRGALVWSFTEGSFRKSKINKFASSQLCKQMTMRSLNTVSKLAHML
jgi:uncharacterized protein (DUF1697 family)